MASQLGALSSNQVLLSRIRDRAVSHVANDTALMASLDPAVSAALAILTTSTGIGRNFTHRLRGINSGQLIYAIKNKLNEFRLQSTIQTDETNSVESQNLGTSSSVLKFVTSQDKTVKLEINNKMGVGKDNLKIVIDKIPAAIGKELNFNIKPGLAGLDILTTAQKVNAQVSIQATISGKTYNRNFGVDIEGGIRLRPSTVLTNNELKIGKIDTLFGQLRNPKMVRGS